MRRFAFWACVIGTALALGASLAAMGHPATDEERPVCPEDFRR